jgi:hypothetical protein
MPRVQWPILGGRPVIKIVLTPAQGGTNIMCTLLADTGAGQAQGRFELLLRESDCLSCGGKPAHTIALGGAYPGTHPLFTIRVEIPQLNFKDDVIAVGLQQVSAGVDGIAGFRFLNRFSYGNFADPGQFGLEN